MQRRFIGMIPGLDGLRALAFLAVLGRHTDTFRFGWVGVQLFFVLSGFLITNILLRMKASFSNKEFFLKFYGRRFLRIFPLYYFYLFILLSLFLLPTSQSLKEELGGSFWNQFWYATSYLYDFYRASASSAPSHFSYHLWSLSIEEHFYIFWPLAIFLTPANKLRKLILAIIALGPLFRICVEILSRYQPALFIDPALAIYVLPFSHVDGFALGAYISQFEIPHPRLQFGMLLLFVPAAGILSQYLATGKIPLDTFGYGIPLYHSYEEIWGYSLLNYLFAVLIYCVVKTGLFVRVLENSILRYLGKISYGLYVYHTAVIWFILHSRLPFHLDTNQLYFFALISTTIVAALSYHLIESPINHLKDRFFSIVS
jgi:peptidoglycan/LPS O-acetylase OafA/YrhL